MTDTDNGNKDLAGGTCQPLASDLLRRELVPYEDAAQALGMEPKRLLGLMLRQRVDDPIGGQAEDGRIYVYGWSLKGLRAAVTDTGAQP